MNGVWGKLLQISIFGESHAPAIGVVIHGLPSGFRPDMDEVRRHMARRAPGKNALSTPRAEADEVEVLSGMVDGVTTGTPLCAMIRNTNTRSGDYEALRHTVRPGHSDYGYFVKSGGYNDVRGGGHASGRLTAPLVFCGSLCRQLLAKYGIEIGAHVRSIAGIQDRAFDTAIDPNALRELTYAEVPLLQTELQDPMTQAILQAREQGDSVGGSIEFAVNGVPAGVGEPFFDSVESTLSHLLFSVPAVKAVAFGDGFGLCDMRGSQANDPWKIQNGQVVTRTNRNGGVLGGITTGMPIVATVAIKPTPSIFQEQDSIDPITNQPCKLKLQGRHDPCIVLRAVPVIESVAAIGIYDLLLQANSQKERK